MGGQYSNLPKPPQDFPYFLLYFHQDTLYMAFVTDRVVEIVHQAVVQCWSRGIQSEGINEHGSTCIKMHGTPFVEGGSADAALQSKRLCCKILSDLLNHGCTLVASSDLSRVSGSSTLFFQQSSVEKKPTQMVCVSLSSFDSLQLVCAPENLKPIFKEAVLHGYVLGIEKDRTVGHDYEIKFKGCPWNAENAETAIHAKKMLLEIFQKFDQAGYQFYGTANLKGAADCIFFISDDQRPSGQHKYLMVSLNQTNKLRLINCPQNVIDCTKHLIEQHWRHGLQEQTDLKNCVWEFTFQGSPWWADEEDAVASRYFITMMFQKYMSLGWCLESSLDICNRQNDKSVFIFKSCQPTPLSHFCIGLNQVDKIRLINAPKEMIDAIRQAIVDGWPSGIKFEGPYIGSHQFKLQGDAWGGRTGNEWLIARGMMTYILRAVMDRGWRVICSVDVSAKYHQNTDTTWVYPLDVDSWFISSTGVAPVHT